MPRPAALGKEAQMTTRKVAVLIVTVAFGAAPALALGSGGKPATAPSGPPSTTPAGPPEGTPPANQGTEHKPSTPGPTASLPAKAKAYGRYCQAQSKTHIAGTPGTAFSKCVTGMAKLATGSVTTSLAACNETDAGERGRLLRCSLSDDAELLDPLGRWRGVEGVSNRIAQFHSGAPGTTVVPRSRVDAHNDVERYAWDIVDPTGTEIME